MSERPTPDAHDAAHWRGNRRLTAALLAVWFGVTFVAVYDARALDFVFFGWPFSFWMAAQGALFVYLAIVVVYAVGLERLDRAHERGRARGQDGPATADAPGPARPGPGEQ